MAELKVTQIRTSDGTVYDVRDEEAQQELPLKAEKDNAVFTGSISLARKNNTAIGTNSVAEGVWTEASGNNSHAEGAYTKAAGSAAHAEGFTTNAEGSYSHAEGYYTQAFANCHAEGMYSRAKGTAAHAEGINTVASGGMTHAEGDNTYALNPGEHAGGVFNHSSKLLSEVQTWSQNVTYEKHEIVKYRANEQSDYVYYSSDAYGNKGKVPGDPSSFLDWHVCTVDDVRYLETIGNGTLNAESNARALDWEGNERLMGDIYVNCTADSKNGTPLGAGYNELRGRRINGSTLENDVTIGTPVNVSGNNYKFVMGGVSNG